MYSKQEASIIRQKFWTSFGQYMRPLPGNDGEPVNWINYKTGNRYVFFRMDASNKQADIFIDFRFPNDEMQQQYFKQFEQFKQMFHETVGEIWEWQPIYVDQYGHTSGRVFKTLTGVNIFNEADWPTIISFLKPRIIALDRFWSLVKDGFEL